MHDLYLGLGSNLYNKEENIHKAVKLINRRIGTVQSLSSFYKTDPWGFESENKFINACTHIKTVLKPRECLKEIKNIEDAMGRIKTLKNAYEDRIIDIDILLYDSVILKENDLIIPHPLLAKRLFVLNPLSEIAGNVIHPEKGKSINELKESY